MLYLRVPVLNTLALAILGPGAYQVDALLFGPRLLLTNRDELTLAVAIRPDPPLSVGWMHATHRRPT